VLVLEAFWSCHDMLRGFNWVWISRNRERSGWHGIVEGIWVTSRAGAQTGKKSRDPG
jgi:hypothetical protein